MGTNKGKSTNSRKNGNSRNKRKNSGRQDFSNLVTVDDSIRDEVVLLAVLAVCILLYLALFNVLGSFGNVIGGILYGLFGIISYIIPIAAFLAIAFYISNKGQSVAYIKVISTIVLILNVCAFVQMAFDKDFVAEKVTDYFIHCMTEKRGGGFFGGILYHLMNKTVGTVGAVVIILVVVIICVVVITERSFFGGVKKGSETIYNQAKDTNERRRERRRERQEYLKEHRETDDKMSRREKVVSGVMLDTRLKPSPKANDDMHEISAKASEAEIDAFESINVKTTHSIDYSEEITPEPEPSFVPEKKSIKNEAYKEEKLSDDVNISTLNNSSKYEGIISDADDIKEITKDTAKEKRPAKKSSVYKFPPKTMLKAGLKNDNMESKEQLKETAARLQSVLKTFGVNVTITDIAQGPTVTRYEMLPEVGTKVSKITGLADDIKLNMAAADIRIEAPIPGKAAVGIEIPNKENATVMFRDLIESKNFKEATSKISFAVGKDLSGDTIVADIGKMPHMLIAGSTGSGKSVCINTLIMSIIYKASPDEVKLIMVDPKVVELSVYNGIPHLMIPVVTDPKKAAAALNWGVSEMSDRYNKFAEQGVRDLKGYNKKIETMEVESEDERPPKLPQIVIIVDELADLMMVASKEVEEAICRLAQLARAAGIHLIIATQRPSVDVITGLIKANMPSRVAFAVSSGTDSRTILDMNGAEKLLGKGDMLFYPQGYPKPTRLQGAFISDDEIAEIVDFLKEQAGENTYNEEVINKVNAQASSSGQGNVASDGGNANDRDDLFVQAAQLVIEQDKASIGFFQRKFKIGFNRAARIMDQLAEAGVVGEDEGTKPRKVLMSMEQFENALEQGEI